MNEALIGATWKVRRDKNLGPILSVNRKYSNKDMELRIPDGLAQFLENAVECCSSSALKETLGISSDALDLLKAIPKRESNDEDNCPACGGLGGIGPDLHRMSCPKEHPYVKGLEEALKNASYISKDTLQAREEVIELRKDLAASNASVEKNYQVAREAIAERHKLEEALESFPLPLLTGGEGPDGKRIHQFVNLATKKMSPRYNTIAEAVLAGAEFYKQSPVNLTATTVSVGIDQDPMKTEDTDG